MSETRDSVRTLPDKMKTKCPRLDVAINADTVLYAVVST